MKQFLEDVLLRQKGCPCGKQWAWVDRTPEHPPPTALRLDGLLAYFYVRSSLNVNKHVRPPSMAEYILEVRPRTQLGRTQDDWRFSIDFTSDWSPTHVQRVLTLVDTGMTTGSVGPWTGSVHGRLWWPHEQGQTSDYDNLAPLAVNIDQQSGCCLRDDFKADLWPPSSDYMCAFHTWSHRCMYPHKHRHTLPCGGSEGEGKGGREGWKERKTERHSETGRQRDRARKREGLSTAYFPAQNIVVSNLTIFFRF